MQARWGMGSKHTGDYNVEFKEKSVGMCEATVLAVSTAGELVLMFGSSINRCAAMSIYALVSCYTP